MNTTSRIATAFAMTLVLAGAALAQDEPADTEKPSTDQPAETKIEDIPDSEIRPIVGVRYRVKLDSGREVIGVVRARGVFECYAGRDGYEPCAQDADGAGVRVWFVSNQDGFIFVPLEEVDEIEELGALSVEDGRRLARQRLEAEKRAENERIRLEKLRAAQLAEIAERRARERAGVTDTGNSDSGSEKSGDVDSAELADLLVRFPPTQWTPETPKEIDRRRVILGLFPSDDEKAFLEVFDKWKIAYDVWAKAQKERQDNS